MVPWAHDQGLSRYKYLFSLEASPALPTPFCLGEEVLILVGSTETDSPVGRTESRANSFKQRPMNCDMPASWVHLLVTGQRLF